MNRETKFRSWNKESKQYVPPMTIQEMVYSTKNEFSLEQLNEWFIFEQYTGLNDNNGREIYINDILKITLENTREIIFPLRDYREFITDSIYNAYYEFEIIGNIHENEELLK